MTEAYYIFANWIFYLKPITVLVSGVNTCCIQSTESSEIFAKENLSIAIWKMHYPLYYNFSHVRRSTKYKYHYSMLLFFSEY